MFLPRVPGDLEDIIIIHSSLGVFEYKVVYWNILEYTGVYWSILEYTGVYWSILEYTVFGVLLYLQVVAIVLCSINILSNAPATTQYTPVYYQYIISILLPICM